MRQGRGAGRARPGSPLRLAASRVGARCRRPGPRCATPRPSARLVWAWPGRGVLHRFVWASALPAIAMLAVRPEGAAASSLSAARRSVLWFIVDPSPALGGQARDDRVWSRSSRASGVSSTALSCSAPSAYEPPRHGVMSSSGHPYGHLAGGPGVLGVGQAWRGAATCPVLGLAALAQGDLREAVARHLIRAEVGRVQLHEPTGLIGGGAGDGRAGATELALRPERAGERRELEGVAVPGAAQRQRLAVLALARLQVDLYVTRRAVGVAADGQIETPCRRDCRCEPCRSGRRETRRVDCARSRACLGDPTPG